MLLACDMFPFLVNITTFTPKLKKNVHIKAKLRN